MGLITYLLVIVGSLTFAQGSVEIRDNYLIVENGTHISRDAFGNITIVEPSGKINYREPQLRSPSKRETNGPVAGVSYPNTDFTYFYSKVIVPADTPYEINNVVPTIYIFFAFENTSLDSVIQPTLQWGTPGPHWYIASRALVHNIGTVTAGYRVYPGNVITGVLSLNNSVWSISTYVNGTLGSYLTVSASNTVGIMNNAVVGTEAYGVFACTQYPIGAPVSFTSIAVNNSGIAVIPTWTVQSYTYSPNCAVSASFTSTEVSFLY